MVNLYSMDELARGERSRKMRDLKMLVWLTQLGLSIALPPAGFVWLAVWLRGRFSLGNWVIFVGIVLGIAGAVDGFRSSLKAMQMMERQNKENGLPSGKPDAHRLGKEADAGHGGRPKNGIS